MCENINEPFDDILFEIDMQLYYEFNDKLCEINDHLGDIYSYRDLEDVQNAQKDKEIYLLRKGIQKLNNQIKQYKRKEKDRYGK